MSDDFVQIENCFYLGRVSKVHGLKGNVSVKIEADNPEEYSNLESVFLKIQGKLVPFFVEEISIGAKGMANIKFEDIEAERWAKFLIGAEMYLPEEMLPELDETTFYFHEIKGYTVVDTVHGEIGEVQEVIEYPHHSILSVNCNGTEVLIPIADATIGDVDRSKNILHVSTPEGLLDLYLNNETEDDFLD